MDSSPNHRSPYLLPVMVLFIFGFLIFLGVLVNYVRSQSPRLPAASQTQVFTYTSTIKPSPSTTGTVTHTPRPTWTLRPSSTVTLTSSPTSTKTPTLIRTLPLAAPARLNTFYELKPWDLSEQDQSISLLNVNTFLVGSDDNFRALAYSEGEGIIRFPDSLEATQWRWDRAYNLVRVGDPVGLESYCEMIQSAIDSGQTRASDLPSWFGQYETRLTLKISFLTPQPGELSRELVEIMGEGSAFLWLVEKPTGTKIYPLLNDIDYQQPHENTFEYGDFTNDGSPEVVIYRRSTPGVTLQFLPHIFDFSRTSPIQFPIQEQAPVDFGLAPITQAEILGVPPANHSLKLLFTLLPACPLYVSQVFFWDGNSFIAKPLQYELAPIPNLLAYCQVAFDAATNSWGPETAITIGNSLIDLWPPTADSQGRPYPVDAFDQLRYRIGIEYALSGNMDNAFHVMSEIIDTPAVPNSAWVAPAQAFLHDYQSADNTYIACQKAQYCNLRDAFQIMVKNRTSQDYEQVLAYLQTHGIAIRSKGFLDFDQDGNQERWLIIQPKPGEKLEFWILYQGQKQVQAVFVQIFEAGEVSPFFHEPAGTVPIFQFELQKGYLFKYLSPHNIAYVQPVEVEYARPTAILDGYHQALNDLMAGGDLLKIRDLLLNLFISPRFSGDCIAFRICDQFHYTLALVYDLTGDGGNAIDEYLWVWRNYGKSPYALMARLKLDYFPLPTYTRTPIPSATITPTRTTTMTPTPTVTGSVTIIPTETETSVVYPGP